MTTRRKAREIALQILYRYDDASVKDRPTPEDLSRELQEHFEHFKIEQPIREFVSELVAGTLLSIEEIDPIIAKHATNWKLGRMAAIDRNILRMAIYEMAHFPDIPASVTIDEAIELSKSFGSTESSSFINGILDAVKQEKSA